MCGFLGHKKDPSQYPSFLMRKSVIHGVYNAILFCLGTIIVILAARGWRDWSRHTGAAVELCDPNVCTLDWLWE